MVAPLSPMSLSQQAIFLYTSSHTVTVIASMILGIKRASRGISLIPITNSCKAKVSFFSNLLTPQIRIHSFWISGFIMCGFLTKLRNIADVQKACCVWLFTDSYTIIELQIVTNCRCIQKDRQYQNSLGRQVTDLQLKADEHDQEDKAETQDADGQADQPPEHAPPPWRIVELLSSCDGTAALDSLQMESTKLHERAKRWVENPEKSRLSAVLTRNWGRGSSRDSAGASSVPHLYASSAPRLFQRSRKSVAQTTLNSANTTQQMSRLV